MISIDYRDRRPIYEQLVSNIEDMVSSGLLKAGEQLPPVRQMALELSINPNTIQRAYSELESRGVVFTVKGRGCFVNDSLDRLLASKRDMLNKELSRVARSAAQLGMDKESFVGQCRLAYEQLKTETKEEQAR